MKINGFGVSGFVLAVFIGAFSTAAYAGCGGGMIEVQNNGSEACVTAEQFPKLSDVVKASADLDDVAEALNEDDDSADGSDNDGPDNDGPDNDGPDNDGSDNDGPDNDGSDNDGSDNDGSDNDGPDNDGPDNDGPDNDGSDSDGDD